MHDAAIGPDRERWGLILAGGEGRRLRPLTSVITPEATPKQFCALLGAETLLERTRRRTALTIPPARTLVVLTRAHEPFYRPFVAGMPPHCAVVQPSDRGTAAAILYGVSRIAAHAPMGAVAILPSDHYVSDDALFMRHVAAAFAVVRTRPDLIVLLGIVARSADPDYGWIEPSEIIPGTPLLRIARFCEKPAPAVAQTLFEGGALWNSFVMVGRVPAFLSLIRSAAPALDAAFAKVRSRLATLAERAAVEAAYVRLRPVGFSDEMLQARPANLAVLPVSGVEWSDWGTPARVMATFDGLGLRPEWAERLAGAAPPHEPAALRASA